MGDNRDGREENEEKEERNSECARQGGLSNEDGCKTNVF